MREELFQRFGPSIQRHELRQLSRVQLRQRLLDLGSAETEGDGTLFNTLVDTVLLWNALNRLQDNEDWGPSQEETLEVLRDAGLSVDLLRRVLLVIGIPWKECQSLNRSRAASLLNEKLARLRPGPVQEEEEVSLEVDCCHERHLRELADLRDGTLEDHRLSIEPSARKVIVEISDEHLGREWHCSDDRDLLEGVPHPAAIGMSRDAKFDSLDADLTECLGTLVERLTPTTPPAPPRDAKFDALDAQLAECMQVSETSPLATGAWASGNSCLTQVDIQHENAAEDLDCDTPMLEIAVDAFIKTSARRQSPRSFTPR